MNGVNFHRALQRAGLARNPETEFARMELIVMKRKQAPKKQKIVTKKRVVSLKIVSNMMKYRGKLQNRDWKNNFPVATCVPPISPVDDKFINLNSRFFGQMVNTLFTINTTDHLRLQVREICSENCNVPFRPVVLIT